MTQRLTEEHVPSTLYTYINSYGVKCYTPSKGLANVLSEVGTEIETIIY